MGHLFGDNFLDMTVRVGTFSFGALAVVCVYEGAVASEAQPFRAHQIICQNGLLLHIQAVNLG